MSQGKDDKDKTNPFVDFLLEEDDDLQLMPTGAVDESAMDFDAEIDSPSEEEVSLDSSFESEDATKQTNVETLVTESPIHENEEIDEDEIRDVTGKLSSQDFPTQITELNNEEDNVVDAELTNESNVSNEYPTTISEQESELVAEEEMSEVELPQEEAHMFSTPVKMESNFTSTTNLQASENLKRAQDKIIDLENEIERLRMENQELGAAGEVLKRKTEEMGGDVDRITLGRREAESRLKDEIQHSQMRLQGKQQEIQDLKVKVESLELRLKRDLQMVRVRERELENRLELVKLENAAVLRSKDEHILELKRKFDQNQIESEQLKDKIRKLAEETDEKQDKIRRTVRTLRLALNMLDEDDVNEIEQELKKSG